MAPMISTRVAVDSLVDQRGGLYTMLMLPTLLRRCPYLLSNEYFDPLLSRPC